MSSQQISQELTIYLAIFIGLLSTLFLVFTTQNPSKFTGEKLLAYQHAIRMDEYLVKFLLFASFLDVVTSVLAVLGKNHSEARKIYASAMITNAFASALYLFTAIGYSHAYKDTTEKQIDVSDATFLESKVVFGGFMCMSTIILESLLWVDLEESGSTKHPVASSNAVQRKNNGTIQKNVNNTNSRA
ncbi:hypothetical protein Ddc_22472 [Ditylenchus destructor]|nr:hypothetical protein Ddc_22472 [Ditylenchus destructor]